jgi:hypothetical protein
MESVIRPVASTLDTTEVLTAGIALLASRSGIPQLSPEEAACLRSDRAYHYNMAAIFSAMLVVLIVVGVMLYAT